MSVYRLFALCCLLTLVLVGCGGDGTTTETAAPQAPAATEAAPAAPAPTTAMATEVPATEVPVVPTDIPATEVPAPTEAPAPEMPTLSAAEGVRAAMVAQLAGGPYHVESVTVSGADSTAVSADVVPPDQFHSTVNLAGETAELIITGGNMWFNPGEGWTGPVSGDAVLRVLEQYVTDPASAGIVISNEQFVGAEAVNGSPTWVYTYNQTFVELEVTSEVKLWVEIATGLPIKVESSSTFAGVASTNNQTITYDDSITISPPQ